MANGWVRVAQRCGRYAYRKALVHVTNPDHYEPSTPAPTGKFLRLAPRYRDK